MNLSIQWDSEVATDSKAFTTLAHKYYIIRFDATVDDCLYLCKSCGPNEAPIIVSFDFGHHSSALLRPEPQEVDSPLLSGVWVHSQLPQPLQPLQELVPVEAVHEEPHSQQTLA